jgi:uncharacterized protein (DUF2225 family)
MKFFNNNENLVNEYIRLYGPSVNIKHIKEVNERHEKSRHEIKKNEAGKDPIYAIKVKCPVCNQTDITCYELRAKSQQIRQNKFLVPIYSGTADYKTVDYSFLSVIVCPRCLFASPDKKDFIRKDLTQHIEKKSQIPHTILMALQEKIGERKALLKSVSDYESYFKRPRYEEVAINSYRLAMTRAQIEAWFEQPYSLYKLAAYSLRIAKIIKDSGGDNREMLTAALNYCEEAFRTSNCPVEEIEMQVIYIIVALALKLGDQKKANAYLGVYTNLRNDRLTEMKTKPSLTTAVIDKWAKKAQFLWEDRDNETLFSEE